MPKTKKKSWQRVNWDDKMRKRKKAAIKKSGLPEPGPWWPPEPRMEEGTPYRALDLRKAKAGGRNPSAIINAFLLASLGMALLLTDGPTPRALIFKIPADKADDFGRRNKSLYQQMPQSAFQQRASDPKRRRRKAGDGRMKMLGNRPVMGNTSLKPSTAAPGPYAWQYDLPDVYDDGITLARRELDAIKQHGGGIAWACFDATNRQAREYTALGAALIPSTPLTNKAITVAPDFHNETHRDTADHKGDGMPFTAACILWYLLGVGTLTGGRFVLKLGEGIGDIHIQPHHGMGIMFDTKAFPHHTEPVTRVGDGDRTQVGTALFARTKVFKACAKLVEDGKKMFADDKVQRMHTAQ